MSRDNGRWTCTLIGAIVLFLLPPLLSVGRMKILAAVVINEVYPKPSNETSEWIELYNTGTDPVPLEGWKLENTAGDKKTHIIASGSTIPANSFLTFYQSQTALSLYNEGDTVRLSDANNNPIDNQSYPSILGYNNSVGRNKDGGGSWTFCTSSTPNQPNNCPLPTNTPTPPPVGGPTQVPTNTPILLATATVTPARTVAPTPIPTSIVTFVPTHPPATAYPDLRQFALRWTLGVASLCIGVLALLALITGLYRKYKHRHEG